MDNKWFKDRGLKVLNYQNNVISKVQENLKQSEITVLAACPSAGKTLMTIYLIEKYLIENPNHKVLVLAHGTTILRTQFYEVLNEVKPNFSFNLVEKFSDYNDSDVNVCLPQTLAGYDLNKIDLLIVDEAHQFYFAEKMMKEIIKKSKPKKQLLLTGTPSPFIRKGFKIIPVTLNTIFDEDMISDLYVEIATSSYSFDPIYDFNTDDELKTNIRIKESETKKTLDDLINKIVERLKSIKGNDYQNLLPEWLPTLKRLEKTMFACRSQQQAMQVQHYFEKIGIKSALSISDIDYKSTEIERFKNESECLILIVVGRGILGFNYPELVNVVDMTTSQNIDRIYQLLCRVIRKHPKGHKKLFFKVAPNIHSDYYKYIMTAVLSLADESFFTKFNGKNFSDMIIPVIKSNSKKENNELKNSNKCKSKPKTLKPIDFEGLPVFEFFKDIYHKKDALLHVYTYTTIKDVRAEFLDRMPTGYWTKEKCIEDALKYKNSSNWKNNNASAYGIACRNGWLNDCLLHMNKLWENKWTYAEVKQSASNYSNINNWRKECSGAYNSACKNEWLDECVKNMNRLIHPNNYWTYDKCIESALEFSNISDWQEKYSGAYSAAKRNGWVEKCTEHMIKKIEWNRENCIEDALKYKTRSKWIKESVGAYDSAKRNGWIEECTQHMTRPENSNLKWTLETCKMDALKYDNLKSWRKLSHVAYSKASCNGWLEECTLHMKRLVRKPWTKDECINDALKYSSASEWQKYSASAYMIALKRNWLNECNKHFKRPLKWTLMTCKLDALKYEKISHWKKNNSSAYKTACENGWVDECTAHMKNKGKK